MDVINMYNHEGKTQWKVRGGRFSDILLSLLSLSQLYSHHFFHDDGIVYFNTTMLGVHSRT